MADAPRISLEQWRALQAVVEAGGYAQAAEALHKSQSTLTYAVQKIERLLDVKVFEIQGRKAVLTEGGQVLYRRARTPHARLRRSGVSGARCGAPRRDHPRARCGGVPAACSRALVRPALARGRRSIARGGALG